MPICDSLVVEDDGSTRLLLHTICRRLGLQTISVGDGHAAIEVLSNARPRVILLDLLLPGVSGFQVLHFIRMTSPAVIQNVIVITASGDPAFAAHEEVRGTRCFMRKPLDIDDLMLHINAGAYGGAALQRQHA